MKMAIPRLPDPEREMTSDETIEILSEEDIIELCMLKTQQFLAIDLYKKEFSRCKFASCRLQDCRFEKVQFSDVVFDSSDLSGSRFTECIFRNVSFSNCKLVGSQFVESYFKDSFFAGAQGRYANFSTAELVNCTMQASSFEDRGLFPGKIPQFQQLEMQFPRRGFYAGGNRRNQFQ